MVQENNFDHGEYVQASPHEYVTYLSNCIQTIRAINHLKCELRIPSISAEFFSALAMEIGELLYTTVAPSKLPFELLYDLELCPFLSWILAANLKELTIAALTVAESIKRQ